MTKNNIKGWFIYKDALILQHSDIESKLHLLFNQIKPNQVLEIGTATGGLTVLIRNLLDSLNLVDTSLRTYDTNKDFDRTVLQEQIDSGSRIELKLKNIFDSDYESLVEKDEIKEFIQRPGTTIVMCDGGSKKNEFRLLAPFLKSGDIIMAHDYAPNEEYFLEFIEGKIWNWFEIQDSHIGSTVDKFNLQPYMQEELQKVVWVCRIKR